MQNKLVIFDLDGVLIDSRDLHYESLNLALKSVDQKYAIPKDEHLSIYDGLNTTKKLKMLTERKGLPVDLYDKIWNEKQKYTIELIKKTQENSYLKNMFSEIKRRGYKIAVASNSIRETVKLSLLFLGVMEYVDYYCSNEDVKRSKPYPEIYWRCMLAMNALPKTTIIVEDSHIGRQAAIDSGANLIPIENSFDLDHNKIYNKMSEIDESVKVKNNIPWRDKNLNVLVLMAGAGSRFANVGYTFPKPLIDVRGKPMIQVVIENLNIEANYIYLVQQSHYEKYNLKYLLNLITPNCKIVTVDGVTEGAACTALLAKELINNNNRLLTVNSDQYIEWNSNEAMYALSADSIDGGILTFKSTHPKYSYVKLNDDGFISEVVEKKVISDLATVGLYYWSKGSDFVSYAEKMIAANKRSNNEFYVAPVYEEAIIDGKKFRSKDVAKMWSLGTPEDLNYFLKEHSDENK
jgi:hypothetical protein